MSDPRTELRKAAISARDSLSPAERATCSRRALQRIVSLPEFRKASVVMLYRAVRGELRLDTLPLHPASAGKRFVYPRCLSAGEMEAFQPGGWAPGAFGIPEPEESSSLRVDPEEIGLVICPGTAFDSRGHRLGMGGGYYDRFLPRCTRAVFLMAAFEAQRTERLPSGPLDVPMRLIVTEASVYRF